MNSFFKKGRNGILILISILMFLPYIQISFYSRPSSDDYSYSKYIINIVRDDNSTIFDLVKGAIDASVFAYNTFDGTFISHPIKFLQPGIYGEQYYFIGSVCLFIFIYICLLFTIYHLHKLFDYKYNIYVEAFFIMSVFLAGMPGINQGVYWFNGAWNYTPFFFLTVLNTALLSRYMFMNQRKISWILFSSLLGFICSGGNYIVSYLNVMVMFAVFLLGLYKKRIEAIVPFLLSVAAFAIEYFAPGRSMKQGDEYIGIYGTIKCSLSTTLANMRQWTTVQWFIWIFIFFLIGYKLKDKISAKIHPLVFIILSIGLIFALYCMPFYGQGNKGPVRVANIIWMTYMILSAMNGLYFAVWFATKYSFKVNVSMSELFCTIALAILFIGASFFIDSNAQITINELKDGTAKLYASQCDARYEAMKNATPGEELETTALVKSKILYEADLTEDPDDWKNRGWKLYYGVGMHITK